MTASPISDLTLLFVTGTRADYGKVEPLALAARADGHRVIFFVTGMHMMHQYGLTKKEVHRGNRFEVIEFPNQSDGDAQELILAKTITGFSNCVQDLRPDLVVVHGDRVEALACSLVCATNYIRCAHVEGGEVSGTIDEIFRHCNTKLAWTHLVSSKEAARRVRRLGESPQSVHVIGSPELDIHCQPSGIDLDQVIKRYDIATKEYGICTFHPVTSEQDNIAAQAQALFDALETSKRYFVVIMPNNDPGSKIINSRIAKLPRNQFRVLPSMRFHYFSELMKNAKAIVGNSSVGVREAPFTGIASLDIGTRQSNRSQASSVYGARAEETDKILQFLNDNWGVRFTSDRSFGKGSATQSFTTLLKSPTFWTPPFQKSFYEDDTP